MKAHLVGAIALCAAPACNVVQSPFAPASPNAAAIAALGWVMIGGSAGILFVVSLLTWVAWRGAGHAPVWLRRESTVIVAGVVLPAVLLCALLAYTVAAARTAPGDAGPPALRVEVVGEQWWWRVRYLHPSGAVDFETANEIRIPTGASVELRLRTADVIHSFWVPALAGKLDMIPGKENRLRLRADRAGTYRGQCAEYCGGAHAQMAFYVIADAPPQIDAWMAQQRSAALPPGGKALHGQQVFLSAGCGACHAVRGLQPFGRIGPDLTHVGSRHSITAASLPNEVSFLARWIVSNQHLKPNNRMPEFRFSRSDLVALASYLKSLQ